jgi:hypothetical protein
LLALLSFPFIGGNDLGDETMSYDVTLFERAKVDALNTSKQSRHV